MSTLQTYNLKHPDASGNQITFTSGGDINFDNGAVYLDSTNNLLGIGTTTVNSLLEVRGTSDGQEIFQVSNTAGSTDGSATNALRFTCNGNAAWAKVRYNAYTHTWGYGGNASVVDAVTIDASGRLLVGTSTARSNLARQGTTGITPFAQIESAVNTYNNGLSIINNSASGFGAMLNLATSYSTSLGSNVIGGSGNQAGTLNFLSNDGTRFVDCAQIAAFIDGTPGADDMPGRLVFSTTADGLSSPTERMRITDGGFIKASAAKGLQLNGYYVTFDNTWHTVDSWATVGNKAGGGSILAISSNHTGVTSGKTNLSLHYIKYDGSPSSNIAIYNSFSLDIRNNSGDLQIKGYDGGTGLNTQGYVTLIYSDSRQHIDN